MAKIELNSRLAKVLSASTQHRIAGFTWNTAGRVAWIAETPSGRYLVKRAWAGEARETLYSGRGLRKALAAYEGALK